MTSSDSPSRPVVLVVDDNQTLNNLLSLLISSQMKAVVLSAHSCSEARRCAATDPPNVLVTDLKLPDGEGLQLAEELRASQPDLRLLIMSADIPDELLLRARRVFTFCAGLHKPFDSRDLLRALGAALQLTTPGDGAAAPRTPAYRPAARPALDIVNEVEVIERDLNSLIVQLEQCADDEQAVRAILSTPLEQLLNQVFELSAALRPTIGR